MLGKILKHGS